MHVRHGFVLFLLLLASTGAGGRSHAQTSSLHLPDGTLHAQESPPGESISSSALALPLARLRFGHGLGPAPLARYEEPQPAFQQIRYDLTGDRRPVVRYTVGGAVLGAALGVAILFMPSDCRTPEDMCGLGIPLYGGAGAVAGGLVGYLIGSSKR